MVGKSLTVSLSLPTEMDEKIEEEKDKHGMTYSQYVREALRGYEPTPFDPEEADQEPVLCADENGSVEDGKTGAA